MDQRPEVVDGPFKTLDEIRLRLPLKVLLCQSDVGLTLLWIILWEWFEDQF